jgi:hypothetical protein
MADKPNEAALAASRLPDLPKAGYATRTQRELSDAIMFLIRGMERDRLLLLETVIQGQRLFRKRFIAAFRVIKADEEFADAVFGYLQRLARLGGDDLHAQKTRILMGSEQAAISTWDKRLRTLLRQAKDRKDLELDIVKESIARQKHRVYS